MAVTDVKSRWEVEEQTQQRCKERLLTGAASLEPQILENKEQRRNEKKRKLKAHWKSFEGLEESWDLIREWKEAEVYQEER